MSDNENQELVSISLSNQTIDEITDVQNDRRCEQLIAKTCAGIIAILMMCIFLIILFGGCLPDDNRRCPFTPYNVTTHT